VHNAVEVIYLMLYKGQRKSHAQKASISPLRYFW